MIIFIDTSNGLQCLVVKSHLAGGRRNYQIIAEILLKKDYLNETCVPECYFYGKLVPTLMASVLLAGCQALATINLKHLVNTLSTFADSL